MIKRIRFKHLCFEVPENIDVWEYEVIVDEEGNNDQLSNGWALIPTEQGWICPATGKHELTQEDAEELLATTLTSEDYSGNPCGASIEGLYFGGKEVVININGPDYEIVDVPTVRSLDGYLGWEAGSAIRCINDNGAQARIFTLTSKYGPEESVTVEFRPDGETRNDLKGEQVNGMKLASENVQDAVNTIRRRHLPGCGVDVYGFKHGLCLGDIRYPEDYRVQVRVSWDDRRSHNEDFLDWVVEQLQKLADKLYSLSRWHEAFPVSLPTPI